jgi:SAM-dependent methyltransferase
MSPEARAAWQRWLAVAPERTHFNYEVEGGDLDRHMELAARVSDDTVARLAAYAGAPHSILEIGCSTGFKAAALKRRYPAAAVAGIDIDDAAIDLARVLAPDIQFQLAPAEHLPFADGAFDLVICLTTIEHVADVGATIAELARVLAPGGAAIVEAPNYLWPVEPHLGIIVPPLAPKPIMRACAVLQGQARHRRYVDHLKLVHPAMLERLFRANRLAWDNLALAKLEAALGDARDGVLAYRRLARLAGLLGRLGLGRAVAHGLGLLRLYPSVMYRLRHA